MTEFIRETRISGLPYAFLIEVNKNSLWDKDFKLPPMEEMSSHGIGGVYRDAYIIYWEEVLGKNISPDVAERAAYAELQGWINKWYGEEVTENNREITKNVSSVYIEKLIGEAVKWQRKIHRHILSGDNFEQGEFEQDWGEAVRGKYNKGFFYSGSGKEIEADKEISRYEKEFVLEYILPDISNIFGQLVITAPPLAEGEIRVYPQVGAELAP